MGGEGGGGLGRHKLPLGPSKEKPTAPVIVFQAMGAERIDTDSTS